MKPHILQWVRKKETFSGYFDSHKNSVSKKSRILVISRKLDQNMWYSVVYRPQSKKNQNYHPNLSQGSMAVVRMRYLVIKSYLVPSHQNRQLGPAGARNIVNTLVS